MKKLRSIINIDLLMLFTFIAIGVIFIGGFLQTNNILFGQSAIVETKGILNPEEGINNNIIPMLETVDKDITPTAKVTILNSTSTQISTNGDIAYASKETTATITYKIRINKKTCVKKATIVIPATSCTDAEDNTDPSNDTSTDTPTDNPTDTPTDTTDDTTNSGGSTTPTDNVPSNAINVTNYGATGNDSSDDTEAINNAINAAVSKGITTVYIPDGTYMINALRSITMRSNTSLLLSSNAILKAITNSSENYAIISIFNVSNVSISGGQIIGERYTHTGTSGEWGMGIDIEGSYNVSVSDVNISNCWGDGIYIGSTSSKSYSQKIIIEDFNLNYNRRQGISVISAKDLIIRNGIISNTNGSLPASAIDMEPNVSANEYMLNVSIENIQAYNNGISGSRFGGWAIDIWFGADQGDSNPYAVPTSRVSVTISNITGSGNYRGMYTTNFESYIEYGYNLTIN